MCVGFTSSLDGEQHDNWAINDNNRVIRLLTNGVLLSSGVLFDTYFTLCCNGIHELVMFATMVRRFGMIYHNDSVVFRGLF